MPGNRVGKAAQVKDVSSEIETKTMQQVHRYAPLVTVANQGSLQLLWMTQGVRNGLLSRIYRKIPVSAMLILVTL